MIKLGLIIPDCNDGTAHYRSSGPLRELRRKYAKEIDYTSIAQMGEGTVGFCDMYFMQRPFVDQHMQQATMIKAHKIPLWLDYDDALDSLPSDNFTRDLYMQSNIQQNYRRLIEMADVVSVSTEHLKKKIDPWNKNVVVIPNAVDLRLFQPMYGDVPRNKIVMWRGSHTHVRDLMTHQEALMAAFKEFPEWNWFFCGYNPWQMTDFMDSKRVLYMPFVNNARTYTEFLQSRRAAIHLVPLHDSEFNRAKSRVSQLEGALAGSHVLCPDWQEWQGGHSTQYKDPADFKTKLFEMLAMPLEKHGEINNADWGWVKENRSLEKVNELRIDLIRRLYGN